MTQFEDVTVLICAWNRATLLEETLASLARMDVPAAIRRELVVVDNNCTDATPEVVERAARTFPVQVRYPFEKQQGKSHALNAGLRASSRPIVAFVDDDVRVARDWLTSLATVFRDRPDITYAGGPVDPIWEEPCPSWFDRTGKARRLRAVVRGDVDERFAAETQLWHFGGQLRERLWRQ
jgi:glycosyltransferase involved in cell wall biosynthesis